MDWIKIGRKIRDARLSKNMSQIQLAEKISCSSAFVCQLESGSKKASVDTLAKISKVLDIKFF